ncbi:single-stranded-DNA-specific exonuclease RecJ [Patescibacteria group bacterium]|nr:single-stranded-DNA-specific exonuclease RecJ [Patescibacteria group bacterium]
MSKVWSIAPRVSQDIVAHLLQSRGVQETEVFLHPDWERDTHAPAVFTAMEQAVERVLFALKNGEAIVIHGDYDADGVSGSTLLYTALRDIAERLKYPFAVNVFLPDREQDGYGVAIHTVDRLGAEGVKVLITVDCGIANGLELARAKELGMDTVVCDHHQMGEHYPSDAIVLHPLAPGESYPNKVLCGTGVAFKFASALFMKARTLGANFPEGVEKWSLDLVAVATVTDVMPLLGENRALEYFGLKVLAKTRRPGLRAIMDISGTDPATVDTQGIGFRIGPRLNAAGRLASATLAFNVLAATDDTSARLAALKLEKLNRERQAVFQTSYALAKIQAAELAKTSQVLVVYDKDWLPGIVGLIAGRLVNDFSLPAFAFTSVGDHVVGSGRSVGGLHLVQAMDACDHNLYVKRGGHPQACGLTLKGEEEVGKFRHEINAYAAHFFGAAGVVDKLNIDGELALAEATLGLAKEVQACAPFGEGNRQPVFATLSAKVIDAVPMGASGSHLRLQVRDKSGSQAKLIGFGFGDLGSSLKIGEELDVAYELGENIWNGRTEVQLRLVDVRRGEK